MFRTTTLILICLYLIAPCLAQDTESIYETTPIDYFGKDEEKTKPALKEKKEGGGELKEKADKTEEKAKEEKKIIEDEWVVPITEADGTIRYHRPPQIVIDFLENPNDKTAEAYLEWNRKKFEKFTKAYAVLQEYAVKKGMTVPYYSSKGSVYDFREIEKYGSVDKYIAETGGLRIIYFSKPDCPYCKVQASELEKFLKNHKDISIQGISSEKVKNKYSFPMRQDKGEGATYNVDFFPTLLFLFPDGKMYRLRGAITTVELEKLIETVKKTRAVQKKK